MDEFRFKILKTQILKDIHIEGSITKAIKKTLKNKVSFGDVYNIGYEIMTESTNPKEDMEEFLNCIETGKIYG